MSYCRFSSGDVYLYASVAGGWCCCMCRLTDKVKTSGIDMMIGNERVYVPPWMEYVDARMETIGEARDHLLSHREVGHQFPDYALSRILQEIEEFGEDWKDEEQGETK